MNRPPHFTAAAGDGATLLDRNELDGLIPDWIATQGDLDAAEFDNVRAGHEWAQSRLGKRNVLDDGFLRELHKRMFQNVWKWAGQYRRTERNIGVAPADIASGVRTLVDDVRYWDEHHTYPRDECAARLHHRLVWIHPFANGNGRTTREFADLYLRVHGAESFTWGRNLGNAAMARDRYLAALRAADAGDYRALIDFVRT